VGNLYVADTLNHTIRKIALPGGVVTTVAGMAGATGSADGVGSAARFNTPLGLAYDGAGKLYVADSANLTIRALDVATSAVTTIAGAVGQAGSLDATGAAARFRGLVGLAYDGAGTLYVADPGNHTLRKLEVATGAVTTYAGTPGRAGVALGPLPATLNSPSGLAILAGGRLAVTDPVENSVLLIR
jgi:DNA-binding beta-propeller fold protein YncE